MNTSRVKPALLPHRRVANPLRPPTLTTLPRPCTVTYTRVWARARLRVLGEDGATTPLARRPHDLRHAAVSMWLLSSGDAAQVARWAGHSTDVLLKIYAKILDGQEERALRRIEEALQM